MYPYDIIPGVSLYVIMICVGIVACFTLFRLLSDKRELDAKIYNLALICGGVGIVIGLFAATLFQALYNIASLGRFEISENTGATFYGGLIGGAAIFLAVYFSVGRTRAKEQYLKSFFKLLSCIAPSIAVAHGFGRVGCLMAGCCHGRLTDAWYGITMYGNMGYGKYVPTQLFEALFLFLLCAILSIRSVKGRSFNFSIYIIAYGIWRFFIEYARADYRGDTFVSFLTPSQLVAVVLVIVGVVLIFVEKYVGKRISTASEGKPNA